METYEIRILSFNGEPGIVTQQKYLNADAAIAAGKLMASGKRFEVWNDDYCVYSGSAALRAAQPPPRLAV